VGHALVRNPILIAMLAGVLFAYLEWPIPLAGERFLDMLAGAAGPTALFALGLTLYGQPLKGDMKEIGWLTLVKLAIHPLVTWALVRFVFVLDPFWEQAAILLAATPTGTLVFVIAQRYRVYAHQAATTVLVTTALSMATLAVVLTLLGKG
jgi:predicted permease